MSPPSCDNNSSTTTNGMDTGTRDVEEVVVVDDDTTTTTSIIKKEETRRNDDDDDTKVVVAAVESSSVVAASASTAAEASVVTTATSKGCSSDGHNRWYIRVADLNLPESLLECSNEQVKHVEMASVDPPAGMDLDPKEFWVALNMENPNHHHQPAGGDTSSCVSAASCVEEEPSSLSAPAPAPAPPAPAAGATPASATPTPSSSSSSSSPSSCCCSSGSCCPPTPIAPATVSALVETGLNIAYDCSMWTIKRQGIQRIGKWQDVTFDRTGGCIPGTSIPLKGARDEEQVLLWSGKLNHGWYGSHFPLGRTAGVLNMSSRALCQLLVDSSRVREYNKLSLGRQDLLIFQDNLFTDNNNNNNNNDDDDDNNNNNNDNNNNNNNCTCAFGSHAVTKIMRAQSAPPVIRRTMQLTSLLHACPLPDQTGYVLVTRAVTLPKIGMEGSNQQEQEDEEEVDYDDLDVQEDMPEDAAPEQQEQQEPQQPPQPSPPDETKSSTSSTTSSTSPPPPPPPPPPPANNKNRKILHGEILLGVNVIKNIQGEDDRCLLINVFHLKSGTNVPMAIANRMVPATAINFVRDLRNTYKNKPQQKQTTTNTPTIATTTNGTTDNTTTTTATTTNKKIPLGSRWGFNRNKK